MDRLDRIEKTLGTLIAWQSLSIGHAGVQKLHEMLYEERTQFEVDNAELIDKIKAIPEQLYDGWAVSREIESFTGKRMSPEDISNVLDAVVRLIKSSQAGENPK